MTADRYWIVDGAPVPCMATVEDDVYRHVVQVFEYEMDLSFKDPIPGCLPQLREWCGLPSRAPGNVVLATTRDRLGTLMRSVWSDEVFSWAWSIATTMKMSIPAKDYAFRHMGWILVQSAWIETYRFTNLDLVRLVDGLQQHADWTPIPDHTELWIEVQQTGQLLERVPYRWLMNALEHGNPRILQRFRRGRMRVPA